MYTSIFSKNNIAISSSVRLKSKYCCISWIWGKKERGGRILEFVITIWMTNVFFPSLGGKEINTYYFTNTEYFKRAQDALKNITFSKFIVKFLTNSIFECYVKNISILFRRIRHALNLIYQYDVCIVVQTLIYWFYVKSFKKSAYNFFFHWLEVHSFFNAMIFLKAWLVWLGKWKVSMY